MPVDDRELPLIFHARTSDYQDVVVQATVTYRIAEPALAAERIDFGIDPRHRAVARDAARAARLVCSPSSRSSTRSTCWPGMRLAEALVEAPRVCASGSRPG